MVEPSLLHTVYIHSLMIQRKSYSMSNAVQHCDKSFDQELCGSTLSNSQVDNVVALGKKHGRGKLTLTQCYIIPQFIIWKRSKWSDITFRMSGFSVISDWTIFHKYRINCVDFIKRIQSSLTCGVLFYAKALRISHLDVGTDCKWTYWMIWLSKTLFSVVCNYFPHVWHSSCKCNASMFNSLFIGDAEKPSQRPVSPTLYII